jgi:polyisoprenoid-binding protein YceI
LLSINIKGQDLIVKDTIVYEIDTLKSYIEWDCDSHNGTVPINDGSLEVCNNEIIGGSFFIQMDSIKDLDIDYDLMRKTLENTLKSNFFFDVAAYPVSEFYIYYVKKIDKSNYLITGNLWIKGLVNCIRFKSSVIFYGNRFIAKTEHFKIDRTLYNILSYSKKVVTDDDSFIVSDSIGFKIYLIGYKKEKY